MNKKKVGIAIAIVLILMIIITIAIVKNTQKNSEEDIPNFEILEDGTKVNTSSKLAETKQIDDLQITDLKLIEKNNITKLSGTVTNTGNKNKDESIISIVLVDKKGNEIATMGAYFMTLKPGESTELKASATLNYVNAYDINLIKVKPLVRK